MDKEQIPSPQKHRARYASAAVSEMPNEGQASPPKRTGSVRNSLFGLLWRQRDGGPEASSSNGISGVGPHSSSNSGLGSGPGAGAGAGPSSAGPSSAGPSSAAGSGAGPSNRSQRSTVGGGDSIFAAFDSMSARELGSVETPRQIAEAGVKTSRVLRAADRYRRSIETMSEAAADFGDTLYALAATKGASVTQTSLPNHTVGTDLQAAGGLHLLISNHMNIFASTIQSQVLGAGQRKHQEFLDRVHKREDEFRTTLRARMRDLKNAETQRSRDARYGPSSNSRNLSAYRNSLMDLTSQIDDINRLKFEFLTDLHALNSELAEQMHASIASTVTAEIEVFENISRKGWSGGGLDGLLAGCPDPFDPGQQPNLFAPGPPRRRRDFPSPSYHGPFDLEPDVDTGNSPPADSGRSPNLFSIIPPGCILPQGRIDPDYHPPPREDGTDIADLTLEGPVFYEGSPSDLEDYTSKAAQEASAEQQFHESLEQALLEVVSQLNESAEDDDEAANAGMLSPAPSPEPYLSHLDTPEAGSESEPGSEPAPSSPP